MKTLDHPYDTSGISQWLRGNLHTHTTHSDGVREPQVVIDDYASRGYDFLAITDHDIFTGERDYAHLQSRGLILIPGNEVTHGGPHLLHLDGSRRLDPSPERQEVIDAAEASAGFIIVNHPNWQKGFNHCSLERLREWQGYIGMEIYNGVVNRLEGSPYALQKWDSLLSEGGRVRGFANDDSHEAGDVGLGWTMVHARERSAAGIAEALRAGSFYASTGVSLTSIVVDGLNIRIQTENAERIVASTAWGRRIATANGSSIEMEVPMKAPYVRFECWGIGEQFAWTQPFFVVEDGEG